MSEFTAAEVMSEIDRQAPLFGIPPKIAKAIFSAENTADGVIAPDRRISGATTSPAGARGVMQTMPATEELLKKAGFLPKEWSYNPADMRGQVQAGLAAIKEMRGRQKNQADVLELLTMYNGGSAAHRNYLTGNVSAIPKETQGYWNKVQNFLGFSMTPAQQQPTSQSTSQTIRVGSSGTVMSPEMMAAAMSSGVELIRAGGNIDTALTDIQRAQQQRIQAEAAQQEAIRQQAVATGASVAASTAVDAGEAARRANILNMANLNPARVGNIADQTMDDIIRGTVDLETMGSEIDQRMAVGIFDNPLEWLVNQVRLPGMVGEYNARVEQQNRKIQATKELQGLAATQISLGQATDADLITRAGTAKAAEAAATAQRQLAETQANAAGAAVRDAQLVLATQTDRVQTAISLAQLTKQIQSENRMLSEKQAGEEAERRAMEQVNKYLKMIGSSTQYDETTFKMLPAKQRENLFALSGTGKIGNDLLTSVDILSTMGNLDRIATEGDAASTVWLKGTVNAARERASAGIKVAKETARISGKPVNEEEFERQAIKEMQLVYAAETADMRTASPYNPMKVDAVTLAKDPGLANNSLALFIQQYGPSSKEPAFTEVDEKYILSRYIHSVATGKTNAAEAARNIAEFYKRGVKFQQESTKYPLFGISPAANGYTVVIPGNSLFTSNRSAPGTLDLTNAAALETYIIKGAAVRAAEMGAGTNTFLGASQGAR